MDQDTPAVAARRVAIGAAVGALDLYGHTFRPVVDLLPDEVARRLAFEVGSGFDALTVATRVDQGRFDRVGALLRQVYGGGDKLARFFTGVAGTLRATTVELAVAEPREGADPALALRFAGKWKVAAVDELLALVRAEQSSRDTLRLVAERLPGDDVVGVALEHASPTSPPVIAVSYANLFALERRSAVQGQLDHVLEGLAVAEPQRRWMVGLVEAMAPRPVNDCPVTVRLGLDGPVGSLAVRYPVVPATLGLKLLSQLANEPRNAARLGAISAAAGIEEDRVDALTLTVNGDDTPRVDLRLECA